MTAEQEATQILLHVQLGFLLICLSFSSSLSQVSADTSLNSQWGSKLLFDVRKAQAVENMGIKFEGLPADATTIEEKKSACASMKVTCMLFRLFNDASIWRFGLVEQTDIPSSLQPSKE